jgi:hypothetical protein
VVSATSQLPSSRYRYAANNLAIVVVLEDRFSTAQLQDLLIRIIFPLLIHLIAHPNCLRRATLCQQKKWHSIGQLSSGWLFWA